MRTIIERAVLILVCMTLVLPLGSCMYSKRDRQSDDEHYKHEPRISDRADLDRNVR